MKKYILKLFVILFILGGCSKENKLFRKVSPSESNIDFKNIITPTTDFNIFTYRNFHNGGGVGIGDIDNDGLLDIYFSSNQQDNKLYKNLGNFKFKDITEQANVKGSKGWSTGVTMEDINGDGWLDIYVCNSGNVHGDDKANELFINNKNGTFTERATQYGIADEGFGTHATFFDFDKDGDLDLYLLNNSFTPISSIGYVNTRNIRDHKGGDKLFENVGNRFVDISEKAGIYGSLIGFGLGVVANDLNNDGWTDIYVSNDFHERDYLYINQKNGTFKEVLLDYMPVISLASMGADIADINNDGFSDIFVTDMLPKDIVRYRQIGSFDGVKRYKMLLNNGFHHQISKNALHLNEGNGIFKEVSASFGVNASDWSWGALIFDMDNDGWNDIFIANGVYKDVTDLDYMDFLADRNNMEAAAAGNKRFNLVNMTKDIPINKVANFAYKNEQGNVFTDVSNKWGLDEKAFSNGAAYGDLDNDGDLDLVINNIEEEALIYENRTNSEINHFLTINIKGEGGNLRGVGTIVTAYKDSLKFKRELVSSRGFQSSVDVRLNFGLGNIQEIDSLKIIFPNNKILKSYKIKTNQFLEFSQSQAKDEFKLINQTKSLFTEVELKTKIEHKENEYSDFDYEELLPRKLSDIGPAFAKGDVNNDGLDDIFIGGSTNMPAQLFIQYNNDFKLSKQDAFEKDKQYEDVSARLKDIDNDGDLDLVVVSGGNENDPNLNAYKHRIYLNNGKGEFNNLESFNANFSASDVEIFDADNDGNKDILITGWSEPKAYGRPQIGKFYLQKNKLEFVETKFSQNVNDLGMITKIKVIDLNKDDFQDVVFATDLGSIKIFENLKGKEFVDKTKEYGLSEYLGWWNAIEFADFDNDGDMDLVAGNWGTNSRYKAEPDKNMKIYVNDFDKNGSTENVLCQYFDEGIYPLLTRKNYIDRMPMLKKKFPDNKKFLDAKLEDFFSQELINSSIVYTVNSLKTMLFENKDNKFIPKELPNQVNYSPTNIIFCDDFNKDGKIDILVGGNCDGLTPAFGKIEGNYGVLLFNKGDFNFEYISNIISGLNVKGVTKHIENIKMGKKETIIFVRNNSTVKLYSKN